MHKQIKQFLNTILPNQFIFHNNKKSIKIQLSTPKSQPLIEYLQSQNIKYTLTTPEYIIHQFYFFSDFTQIVIKK